MAGREAADTEADAELKKLRSSFARTAPPSTRKNTEIRAIDGRGRLVIKCVDATCAYEARQILAGLTDRKVKTTFSDK